MSLPVKARIENALSGLTPSELRAKATNMAASLARTREKAKLPLRQFGCTAAGWFGGATSGVTHYFLPDVMGVPVDGAVGVLVSLGALFAAGDSLGDATAVFGVGLASPAISRGVENGIRTIRAKSAAKK